MKHAVQIIMSPVKEIDGYERTIKISLNLDLNRYFKEAALRQQNQEV